MQFMSSSTSFPPTDNDLIELRVTQRTFEGMPPMRWPERGDMMAFRESLFGAVADNDSAFAKTLVVRDRSGGTASRSLRIILMTGVLYRGGVTVTTL